MSTKRERKSKKKTYKKQTHNPLPQPVRTASEPLPSRRKSIPNAVILVGIFCLILFMNSYFNYTSNVAINPDATTVETKYLLSGPDPYYNMRICKDVMETGEYNYLNPYDKDPMLNYPMGGRGIRPPLFNMICVATTSLLETVMPHMDAFGLAMLFLPALYGALMVFPVYHMGRDLFNKKVGLFSALFVALIPIHIGGSHGSSLSLFDHDSFLFLLSALLFMFIIKSLRTENKDKTLIFGALAGMVLGAIYLTWTAARFFFIILMAYLAIQFLFDIIRMDKQIKSYLSIIMTSVIAFIIALPYMMIREEMYAFPFILLGFSLVIFFVKETNLKWNLPWLISIPAIGAVLSAFLSYIYLISAGILSAPIPAFSVLSNMIFGSGIYGSKISTTIAEAGAYNISQTVMSFGIALYWFAILGLILYFYQARKDKFQIHNIFFVTIAIVYLWLSTTAGRFVNDLIPFVAILSAYFIFSVIDKINYKELMKTLQVTHSYKSIRLKHIAGISMVAFLIVLPNSFMVFDASVPAPLKDDFFGPDFEGAHGLSLGKSSYWADACYWLTQQDTEIPNNEDKPAVISWWDYGFYLSSMSDHPTVADNFQEGIVPAGNFHTAQSESEAIAVLAIRLIEGEKIATATGDVIKGKIGNDEIIHLIHQYFPENGTKLQNILEDPEKHAESYNTLVNEEYGNTVYRVTAKNAMYHDATDILLTLPEDDLVSFHKLVEVYTGHSIRYYAVEQYDQQIFIIFPFLSDKGTYQHTTYEDDFYGTTFIDKNNNEYTEEEIQNLSQRAIDKLGIESRAIYKEAYYNSMWHRTWNGPNYLENRIPTYGMRHFYLTYYTPYVVIAKYYAGCKLTAELKINDEITMNGAQFALVDELGILHDIQPTINGTATILAPPGNNTISIYIANNEVHTYNVIVTEEQANREGITPATDHISIDYAQATINFTNVTNTPTVTVKDAAFGAYNSTFPTTSQLQLIDIIPSVYSFEFKNETGVIISSENHFLSPNENLLTLDGGSKT